MSAEYTRLKGLSEYSDCLLSAQITNNIITFFDWGFLNIGAFQNVNVPTSGAYGGDFSVLRRVSDNRFTGYTTFEAARANWVWESGTDYAVKPIQCSGVIVNGTFHHSSGVGTYSHIVDFPAGQIRFTNPVSGVTVQARYSYKSCPFFSIDSPYFSEIQKDAYRVDDSNYLSGSGSYVVPSRYRRSLPCVGIEVSPRSTARGMQLGGGQWFEQDVNFHVIAETVYERNHICDILKLQNEKTIRLFNINDAPAPLDYRGSIASGALCYPDLVRGVDASGFYYKNLRFKDFYCQTFNNYGKNLFSAVVNVTAEINMDEI